MSLGSEINASCFTLVCTVITVRNFTFVMLKNFPSETVAYSLSCPNILQISTFLLHSSNRFLLEC